MINNSDCQLGLPFAPDQLVVASAHAKLVVYVLAKEMQVAAVEKSSDPQLGLTLLGIQGGFENYPQKVLDSKSSLEARHEKEFAELRKGKDAAWPFEKLDALLMELRDELGQKYGRWTPLLGKNRDADAIVGWPNPKPFTGAGALGADNPLLNLEVAFGVDKAPPALGEVPRRVATSADAGRNVRVGILDTGLYPHDELAGRYIAGPDTLFAPTVSGVVAPVAGHATLIADLIRRQAPAVQLVAEKVLDNEFGNATLWETATAMMRFAGSGIDVLNLSLGCYTVDGEAPFVLRRAIELLSPEMVIVAAAGNHGKKEANQPCAVTPRSPAWPAALNDVVAVGAHRSDDPNHIADFSPQLPWMRFTAMGTGVTGAFIDACVRVPNAPEPKPSHGRVRWGGTSFAAATVSGVIAANTRPGERSAHQALAELSDDPGSVVKRYPRAEQGGDDR
jgi:membrane-anchored mycosin MYCP